MKMSRTVIERREVSPSAENSESKQTLSLASDGMAQSLFPTILPDSSVHNHTNQVVVTTNVPDLIRFSPKGGGKKTLLSLPFM